MSHAFLNFNYFYNVLGPDIHVNTYCTNNTLYVSLAAATLTINSLWCALLEQFEHETKAARLQTDQMALKIMWPTAKSTVWCMMKGIPSFLCVLHEAEIPQAGRLHSLKGKILVLLKCKVHCRRKPTLIRKTNHIMVTNKKHLAADND